MNAIAQFAHLSLIFGQLVYWFYGRERAAQSTEIFWRACLYPSAESGAA